jgi:hypothetical protein
VPIAAISIGYEEIFDAEQRANAAFIVKAVNAHDALVEALENALLWTDEEHDVDEWRDKARAALALAGGGR